MSTRFCSACGAALQEQEQFCSACGAPAVPMEVTPTEPPAEELPVQPEAPMVMGTGTPAGTHKTLAQRYRKRGAGRTVAAIFVCIFLFLFAFTAMLVWDVRGLVTGNAIGNILSDYVKSVDLTEIKAQDILPEVADPNASIVDWAISEVAETSGGELQISKAQIEEFLSRSDIPDVIEEKTDAIIAMISGEEVEDLLTRDELFDIMTNNAELIEEVFGVEVTPERINAMLDQMEESGMFETFESENFVATIEQALQTADSPFVNLAEIQATIAAVTTWVNILFFIMIGLIVIFVFLLVLCNRWNLLKSARDLGITLMVVGAIFTAVAFAGALFAGIPTVGPMIASYLRTTLTAALVVLIFGFVLVVTFTVGRILVYRSAKKQ